MSKETNVKYASSFKEQLTVRGIVIGVIGSIILTCSSMFVALKASSLPWPIMFVALASMFGLKALGNTNVNEINVTHTAMSAGSMVAGGLAFTIPGIFILNNNAEINALHIMVVTVGGSILGLIFTSLLRKHFVDHPDHFDPRQYLKPARIAIKDMVAHKLVNVLGCDGKA